jgi:pimeloyl-ACP methyl ester carboxylesterase
MEPFMFEEEMQLNKRAEQIVAGMVAANVVQKKVYFDERVGKEYSNLVTEGAFDKKFIAIAVLGFPERAGVWSYSLLGQGRVKESSMEGYFREFAKHGMGLVAIDPNFFGPDIEGESFVYQLSKVIADISPEKAISLIGFSMGGKILVEYLEQRPELQERICGLVLIDPTLPNRLDVGNIRGLLDENTLLIASEGAVQSPGDIASVLLQIPKITIAGIHGEMPNKALGEIIEFYRGRLPS